MHARVIATSAALIVIGGSVFAAARSRPQAVQSAGVLPPVSNASALDRAHNIRIPILVYHSFRAHFPGETAIQRIYDVESTTFAQQLEHLRAGGYTSITSAALAGTLTRGAALPPKPVLITIDDGWESQYTTALPLLERYGFSATFFVYTNVLDRPHFMTWAQVHDLDARGMEIGAHTKSHPRLDQITDSQRLREEIVDSKKILEQKLGHPITAFAYPFGRYTDAAIALVREAGFQIARSGTPAHRDAARISTYTPTDRFTLDSIQVGNDVQRFDAMLRAVASPPAP